MQGGPRVCLVRRQCRDVRGVTEQPWGLLQGQSSRRARPQGGSEIGLTGEPGGTTVAGARACSASSGSLKRLRVRSQADLRSLPGNFKVLALA